MTAITREGAEELDRSDPLAPFRDRFVAPSEGLRYLDGHSLGALPKAAVGAIRQTVADEWGAHLVESWEEWIDLPQRTGTHLAPLLGADPGAVSLADSTSVNLYKLAAAAIDAFPNRGTIVTEADNFPTDRYVLDGLARSRGRRLRLVDGDPVAGPSPDDVAATVDDDTALVCLSLVSYRSSSLADMAAINDVARRHGALTLWDLSHAVGAVPIDLEGTGSDLAVGCTYKYLCGGPGAPAFLYVRRALQRTLQPPIWGWFGHRDQFAFEQAFTPATGIERFLVGTPPIISVVGALAGIDLIAEAGIDRIRAKNQTMTEMMINQYDAWLAPLDVGLASPRDPEQRGSHLAFSHAAGLSITRHLRHAHRIVMDFRAPSTIRAAVAAPSTSYAEVWDAMAALRDTIRRSDHAGAARPGRVT